MTKCRHKKHEFKKEDDKDNDGLEESASIIAIRRKRTCYLDLSLVPLSTNAERFVEEVARKLHTSTKVAKPGKPRITAIAAVLAGLLRCSDDDPGSVAYRTMASGAFTTEPVGYRVTFDVLKGLDAAGWIEWRTGAKALSGKKTRGDKAAEFTILEPLITAAAKHGITPENWGAHFATGAISIAPSSFVKRRRGRGDDWWDRPDRGEDMLVDPHHPRVIESEKKLADISRFLSGRSITAIADGESERSTCHRYFERIFCMGEVADFDYDRAGRIYSKGDNSYQHLSKKARQSVLIDGDETVEIDIRACQLVILHAMLGAPLDPDLDPYEGAGEERDVLKAYVMQALGCGKLPDRWSNCIARRYAKDSDGRCLHCDHPAKRVRQAVVLRFPILADWETCEVRWYDLQYMDSEVILEAVHTLALEFNVAALPVHDSLIVKKKEREIAKAALEAIFLKHVGVKPYIKG